MAGDDLSSDDEVVPSGPSGRRGKLATYNAATVSAMHQQESQPAGAQEPSSPPLSPTKANSRRQASAKRAVPRGSPWFQSLFSGGRSITRHARISERATEQQTSGIQREKSTRNNLRHHVKTDEFDDLHHTPDEPRRIAEVLQAGSLAFEVLQGQPPQLLGHAPMIRKAAFKAQRTGEHAVAFNLLLLAIQYDPVPPEALADIDTALKRVGMMKVTAMQRAKLVVARYLAMHKSLERKEWQRLLVHLGTNTEWTDDATPALVELVCMLLGRGNTFVKNEAVLCWEESGRCWVKGHMAEPGTDTQKRRVVIHQHKPGKAFEMAGRVHVLPRWAVLHDCEEKSYVPGMMLNEAAEKGNTLVVQELLKREVSPFEADCNANTPLLYAAVGCHQGCITSLLEAGASAEVPNVHKMSPIDVALVQGNPALRRLMRPSFSDLDVTEAAVDRSHLYAAAKGDVRGAEALKKVANIDETAANGVTALMLAARQGHLEMVKKLLSMKASVSARSTHGCTALSMAAEEGHAQVADVLVEHGSDVAQLDNKNYTPLMRAAENGHSDAVKYLLTHGSPVDLVNDQGSTALMLAAWNGSQTCVELLLKGGASSSITRKYKEREEEYTALCFATTAGHVRTIHSLLVHGDTPEQQKIKLAIAIAAELQHDTAQETLECYEGETEAHFVSPTGRYQHQKGVKGGGGVPNKRKSAPNSPQKQNAVSI
ncbi:hypothetical protein AB1Y20_004129 [Prymnesium parvum]|uniref:Uncharacterized protein n=1 Tax=Prymnesium parvum TaxID=97485 RepID=A0AB34J920_PRYPA